MNTELPPEKEKEIQELFKQGNTIKIKTELAKNMVNSFIQESIERATGDLESDVAKRAISRNITRTVVKHIIDKEGFAKTPFGETLDKESIDAMREEAKRIKEASKDENKTP